ncbi:MAG: DUF4147 domain-containing protein, partial [Thiohalobacteraceae bacterium]
PFNSDRAACRSLWDVYRAALAAVGGRRCVASSLRARPLHGPVYAVAIGKAAASMLDGAFDVLGDRLRRAFLVTKRGHASSRPDVRVETHETGHPIPDAASLLAGERLLHFLGAAPPDVEWLFLISGGASSLVEVLPERIGLAALQRLNAWLVASGLPIEQINRVRQRVSRIKGGRLRGYLNARPARALFISDVPNDDPGMIGSGLLHASPADSALPPLPAEFARCLEADEVFTPVAAGPLETEIVANLERALRAAERAAANLGLTVHRHTEALTGDATAVGRRLAATVMRGSPGIHLWGGETTMVLPDCPGQGGRCQQLALAAAEMLDGRSDIALLAAGTDGSDGPGEAAGAWVDGRTLQRGDAAGLDIRQALSNADSGRFLEAAGGLLETGPTGTNVTDLVVALKRPSGLP